MATDEKAQSVSAEEFFKSCDYTGSDFRKESHLYRQFYYDEIYTAPGLSWCTEYYYRRMPDGRYRFVMIDAHDNELSGHEVYDTPQEFAKDIRAVGSEDEMLEDESLLENILALCPNDIRRYRRIVRSHFNDRTASLLVDALSRGYRDLVRALLPSFEAIREGIYPAPYIPQVSRGEIERRRQMLRSYYLAEGYEQGSDGVLRKEGGRGSGYAVYFDERNINRSSYWRGYGNCSAIPLDDTDELRKAYPGLDFGQEGE